MRKKKILIIDAQGGGLGRQLITEIRKTDPKIHITAVGTNSTATLAMLKAGADEAATGENAVVVTSRDADVILGPVGIVIADSMLGEITPKMAASAAQSKACKILIPFNGCNIHIAGVNGISTGALMQGALKELHAFLQEDKD